MSIKRKDGPMNRAKNRPPFSDVNQAYGVGDARVINGPADADERKTVILDSELEGLEFDDKVWLFWRRNKTYIVLVVAAVFVSAAVSGLWRTFSENSKNSLAGEYAAASSAEQRAAFAAENSGKPLAGVALIENADAFFSDGKFAEAASSYKAAHASLSGTPMYGRALLGEAVSLVKSGKSEEGLAALVALEGNAEAGVFGVEAAYHLAMEDLSKGRLEEAKARFEKIATNPLAGEWAAVAQNNMSKLSGK